MHRIKGLAAVMLAAGTLSAQESWDTSFKLVVGRSNQSAVDGAGSPTQVGLSLEGAYPLPSNFGGLVFEAGYRKFLNATFNDPAIPNPPPPPASGSSTFRGTDLESSSQGWLASALWQRKMGPEGLYLEAGLRWTAFISRETWTPRTVTVTSTGTVTGTAQASRTGSFDHRGIGPVVGAGFRFDGITSLDLQLSRQAVPTADGSTRTLTVLELGLGTHF
ncbi:MAG TPA: hypothetical protein VL181_08720 [Holophagaceae bacterium]|jgi:hypothetical protein|nr:hypothetical protein [Holophagaceae bacterium]